MARRFFDVSFCFYKFFCYTKKQHYPENSVFRGLVKEINSRVIPEEKVCTLFSLSDIYL